MLKPLCLALAVVATQTTAAAAQTPARVRHLAYALPGMQDVRRIPDQVYRSLAGTPDTVMYGASLRFDVFLPAQQAPARRGGVVFIHGGLVPDTQRVSPKDDLPSYREWGQLTAAAGLVAITFSHRLTTQENIDVAASDVAELLRTVRARGAEWQLDPDRLCVAVFSAGGPLSSVFLKQPSEARCVVAYYPFMDTEHAALHTEFRRAHPPDRVAELMRYSPRAAVLANGSRIPPLFVTRGGRDAIPGINASIDRFIQAALWVNASLDLHVHATGPHGFDMVAQPDARSAEIVAATIAFFQRHLQ